MYNNVQPYPSSLFLEKAVVKVIITNNLAKLFKPKRMYLLPCIVLGQVSATIWLETESVCEKVISFSISWRDFAANDVV